ncbi:MAG TPA: cobalamin biosynthesis protein [Paraburkholderia sp.]|jgi:cobalamin biosynthesis protein CbiG|nr:cobalamin biosynthesis protein [Paraburkholderia sp.]
MNHVIEQATERTMTHAIKQATARAMTLAIEQTSQQTLKQVVKPASRPLALGIGCRANSSAGQIEAAVRAALGPYAFGDVARVASIDSKAQEAGLLDFCARHALPLNLFSKDQINATPTSTPSSAARAHLGVDGVCEPCALLAARDAFADGQHPGSSSRFTVHLLVRKTMHDGVTVAIATATAQSPADRPTLDNDTRKQDLS